MADIRIAIYIRLSHADEETGKKKDESNSVGNQRTLIHRFLDNHKELSGYPRTEFVDDGFTGTNTDRPAFQRMMEQIRAGKYNLCITKDFSRFMRDYVEMGDYLEYLFPLHNVRYISINDGYDSKDYKGTTGGLEVVMRTIVYDAYSKDLSAKEMAGKRQSRKKGRRATGDPPYGYISDPDNKGMDIIDPEASRIVRRIFDEAIAGRTLGEITEGLNKDLIPPPSQYWRMKHPESNKYKHVSDKACWTYRTISEIVHRYSYTGASVGGLRRLAAPCSKSTFVNKPEDWIVVPDMHEAIVSVEEYNKANEVVRKKEKTKERRSLEYPLKSLVFCANCGRRMILQSPCGKFACERGRYSVGITCKGRKTQKEQELNEIVYAAIQNWITVFDESAKKRKAARKNRRNGNSEEESVPKLRERIESIRRKKLREYEAYCSESISKEIFLEKKKLLDEEILTVEDRIRELEEAASGQLDEVVVYSEMEAVCDSFRGKEFSNEMTRAFVEKVLVYDDERIEIVCRFKEQLMELE